MPRFFITSAAFDEVRNLDQRRGRGRLLGMGRHTGRQLNQL